MAEQWRELGDVVVSQVEGQQVAQVVHKSNGDLAELVRAEIEHLEVAEVAPAELAYL
jgi:hypothetical protein